MHDFLSVQGEWGVGTSILHWDWGKCSVVAKRQPVPEDVARPINDPASFFQSTVLFIPAIVAIAHTVKH